jgi:predicted component of type VI protein secretion system
MVSHSVRSAVLAELVSDPPLGSRRKDRKLVWRRWHSIERERRCGQPLFCLAHAEDRELVRLIWETRNFILRKLPGRSTHFEQEARHRCDRESLKLTHGHSIFLARFTHAPRRWRAAPHPAQRKCSRREPRCRGVRLRKQARLYYKCPPTAPGGDWIYL